jgi:hypothetical protein
VRLFHYLSVRGRQIFKKESNEEFLYECQRVSSPNLKPWNASEQFLRNVVACASVIREITFVELGPRPGPQDSFSGHHVQRSADKDFAGMLILQ